jgi:hypothetical protein
MALELLNMLLAIRGSKIQIIMTSEISKAIVSANYYQALRFFK